MMSNFHMQLETIGSALLLIQKLSDQEVWALECTNDDDAESPSVLNIFTEPERWPHLILLLRLGKPVDSYKTFLSFRQGTLHISLIKPEEEKNNA
jgi:hypothetical protein